MFRIPLIAVACIALALPLAPEAAADTVSAVCPDSLWMKLSRDSVTGQEMVCGGSYPDTYLTWKATGKPPATSFANLPLVGAAGSPCTIPTVPFGQSRDGYVVECRGGKVLLPGKKDFIDSATPVWSLYQP